MVYLPSSRIWNLMKVESAGVWLDRSSSAPELWMVSKLPMNIIRAVNAGAAVSLCAWVVEIDGKQIAAFGLRVDDDLQHPFHVYGACRKQSSWKICARSSPRPPSPSSSTTKSLCRSSTPTA